MYCFLQLSWTLSIWNLKTKKSGPDWKRMRNGKVESKKNFWREKNKKKPKPPKPISLYSDFVEEAGPGCFIARRNSGGSKPEAPEWMIGWEDVDPEDFGLDDIADDDDCEVPDIALDPEECTLSVCNVHNYTKVVYVTVFEARVVGANGVALKQGTTTNNDGETVPCQTCGHCLKIFKWVNMIFARVGIK